MRILKPEAPTKAGKWATVEIFYGDDPITNKSFNLVAPTKLANTGARGIARVYVADDGTVEVRGLEFPKVYRHDGYMSFKPAETNIPALNEFVAKNLAALHPQYEAEP
jgi:hypothetical protein